MKALLLALVITLLPVKASVPTLTRLGAEKYRVTNPLFAPVVITVECVGGYEPVQVNVPAGTSLDLEIVQPSGHAAMCVLASWVRA